MTSADSGAVPTVTSDGVTVEKSFEPNDFPVPAIAFTLRSDRELPVSVRLVDSVPEDVSPENIGFHPKYGAEFWDVDGDGIVFQRELAPEEEYTTVYGLRGDDGDHPEKFLSEPILESVTPRPEDDEADDAADGEAVDEDVDDAIDGETVGEDDAVDHDSDTASNGGPDPTEESDGQEIDPDDADEAVEEPDADHQAEAVGDHEGTVSIGSDPDDPIADTPEPSDSVEGSSEAIDNADVGPEGGGAADTPAPHGAADDDAGGESDPPAHASEGALLETLAAEIEAADPDDPRVAALRDALGVNLSRATVEARIEHLQSAVSDLEAYTDALEEFLDENGDGRRVIADLREESDEMAERLDDVEATAGTTAESVEAIESRLDAELGDVDAEIDDVRSDVEALEAELESLSTELSAVIEMRDRLASALGGLGADPNDDGGDGENDEGGDGEDEPN